MIVLDELLAKLTISKEADQIKEASQNLAVFINGSIEELDTPTKYVSNLFVNPSDWRRKMGKFLLPTCTLQRMSSSWRGSTVAFSPSQKGYAWCRAANLYNAGLSRPSRSSLSTRRMRAPESALSMPFRPLLTTPIPPLL